MFQQLDIAIAFVAVMLLLSLLVTAIVQAISAVFDLRGKNLTRALADLFKQIDSELNAPFVWEGAKPWMNKVRDRLAHPFTRITVATKIADAVTTHPILAHTFTRAKSVRKEELLYALKDLCAEDTIGTIDPTAKAGLQRIVDEQVPGAGATADLAQKLTLELGNKFPGLPEQVGEVVTATIGSLSRVEAGIEKWFDAVMDRSSDVFTRWTRAITIAISALLVAVLQIDAGLILKQVSTEPGVRAGLEKLSEAALAQADEALKAGNRGTAALKAIAEKYSSEPWAADLRNAPPLATCSAGSHWLEDYSKRNHSDISRLQQEFENMCQQMTLVVLSNSEDQISRIRRELAETNLQIVPAGVAGKPIFTDFRDWSRGYRSRSHLLGTLAMVVLLSLGAPFWFHVLKQLTNLKPSVTQKIEKEESEDR